MDFIDQAIEKQKTRLGADKAAQIVGTDEAEKQDRELRRQVDLVLSKVVLPVLSEAQRKLQQGGMRAEIDLEASRALGIEKSYYKGIKLELNKLVDRKTSTVAGPSLYFSASPPYSMTMAIVAYGTDNSAIFSERFEMQEMTEDLVVTFLKRFIEEVIR